jgi:hypothetical protein
MNKLTLNKYLWKKSKLMWLVSTIFPYLFWLSVLAFFIEPFIEDITYRNILHLLTSYIVGIAVAQFIGFQKDGDKWARQIRRLEAIESEFKYLMKIMENKEDKKIN